ncbi:SCO2521 family protein [Nocardia yamanashiensis]|uniref:SCO2521 family protein n=1 Tax=Nocardia yamanashiensis TaxID=209247 RepID=UPI001E342748|nr:SCO2521 family protein [Nocardia yamanashiensis]UGT40576.1 SCO2521 family protein [Nocardia yamanashiensis]
MTDPLVLLGEVQTSLLPNSFALPHDRVAELLTLLPGQPLARRQRPVALAISPNTIHGVDTGLATLSRSGRRAVGRAIGTVASRAVVTGGRIAQSSSSTRVIRAEVPERRPWLHYLAGVGTVELISKITDTAADDLARGFLDSADGGTLDLRSISERLLTRMRMDQSLDHQVPLRTAATRTRWAARVSSQPEGSERHVAFRLESETLRSIRIVVPDVRELDWVQRFCEDMAVHDWLLTTLTMALQAVVPGEDGITVAAPVLEHLIHLWMPSAHMPATLRPLWTLLETEAGFSRQWNAQIGQLRDMVAVATLRALRANDVRGNDW